MKILVDLDSTLVDILTPTLKILNKKFKKEVKLEDITSWDKITEIFPKDAFYNLVESDNFYTDYVLPIAGSKEFIENLAKNNEIILVSSGKNSTEKVNYIIKTYNNKFSDIIFTYNKHEIKGDVLIDDNFQTIYKWVKSTDKLGILFRNNGLYKWNDVLWKHRKFKWKNTYKEILKEIECIK